MFFFATSTPKKEEKEEKKLWRKYHEKFNGNMMENLEINPKHNVRSAY